MPAPTIVVKDLKKSFGEQMVLKGVNLTLDSGKINFIIGRSGGGKSVLLKHLTALMTPDSGDIFYDLFSIFRANKKELFELRIHMGLLFQEGALFDSLSVGENVSFPAWYHRTMKAKDIKEKASELLKDLGLEGSFTRSVGELSQGEKKRVAIARALILEPQVLFFDEPTTGLDPLLSGVVDELITEVGKRTGATIVVVSHDIAATLTIAHKINLIHDGRVFLSGSPEDFKISKDEVVKEFIFGEDSNKAI